MPRMAMTARTLSTMINTMPRRRPTAFRNMLIKALLISCPSTRSIFVNLVFVVGHGPLDVPVPARGNGPLPRQLDLQVDVHRVDPAVGRVELDHRIARGGELDLPFHGPLALLLVRLLHRGRGADDLQAPAVLGGLLDEGGLELQPDLV